MNRFGTAGRIALLVGACLLVFFITRALYRPDAPTEQVSSDVLLERIRPVMKLVTVEGDYSELYTYSDADATFSWLRQFSPFQKKAILRVKARASVGYDLEGLGLVFDEATRTVRFNGMGAPALLALEHDVDYYDMEEGTFNSFTAADLTKVNAQAKELIRQKVAASNLFASAEQQKGEFLVLLRAVVESAGWTFVDEAAPKDGRARLKD